MAWSNRNGHLTVALKGFAQLLGCMCILCPAGNRQRMKAALLNTALCYYQTILIWSERDTLNFLALHSSHWNTCVSTRP